MSGVDERGEIFVVRERAVGAQELPKLVVAERGQTFDVVEATGRCAAEDEPKVGDEMWWPSGLIIFH